MALTFQANGRTYRAPERPVLAVCADGWDPDYVDDALERRLMPRLAETLTAGGTYELARAQVPTFTNPNNVAIVTGVSAAENGIVAGNHYLDGSGGEVQVTDPSFLRSTTIYAAAARAGVPVLCVTAKDKLRRLLATGGVPAFSAERAHEQALEDGTPITDVVGRANPGIYDWELSIYTIDLALALADRTRARLVYASLTDFVQHSAAPGEPLADEFYRAADAALGRALDAGFTVGLVADHGMRAKAGADGAPNVRYLDEALAAAGVTGLPDAVPRSPTRMWSITPRWARWPGSTSRSSQSSTAPGARWRRCPGWRGCSTAPAAAAAFDLPGDRIGDLIVLGDAHGTPCSAARARTHDLSARCTAPCAPTAACTRAHRSAHRLRPAAGGRAWPGASCTTATSTTSCSTP